MQFVRIHPDAKLPQRQTDGAAGYDLHCLADHEVHALTRVPTGIGVVIPKGWVGMIRDRSGLAVRQGITTLAGIIDDDYTGEVVVVLSCVLKGGAEIKAGERIAQLVIVPCLQEPSEWTDRVNQSARGARGFGSTGE